MHISQWLYLFRSLLKGLRVSCNYFNPVRADASSGSAVNAALRTSRDYFNPVRAELVEVYEHI